jgi:hypothetical protein
MLTDDVTQDVMDAPVVRPRPCMVMRRESPSLAVSPPLARTARALTALWALLCLVAFLTASGPHLVHYLGDQPSSQAPSDAHTPPPQGCVVLALVQHLFVVEPLGGLAAVVLPQVEAPGEAPRVETLRPLRPSLQARSPPAMPCPAQTGPARPWRGGGRPAAMSPMTRQGGCRCSDAC